ncbi:MAG TPA: hypothetical protein VH637_03685 [Streptosporangiaceae bacterium]|jgi:hypothetical protein
MSTQTEPALATGDINVQRAFRLGWRFAQLYHEPHRATLEASARTGKLPKHLPSLGELSAGNRTELILREIEHDITALKPELAAADDDDPASLDTMLKVMRGPIDSKGKKTQVLLTFRRLRIEIGADDAHLSTAIDLGRMLADTVILANSPGAYLTEFETSRLQNAYEWLEDLHTSFPDHASDAVKGSLQYWQQWVANTGGVAPAGQDQRVRRMLSLQGERWRRLLSGEILARDLLSADSYRKAASDYLGRIGRLVWSFVRRFWLAVIIVLGGTGAIVWTIVAYAPGGAASVAALIATAAGSLGVSWKTVGSTLGKVATQAEQPLWNAEVVEAIVVATFIPPVEMKDRAITSLRKQASGPKALAGAPPAQGEPAPPPEPGGESLNALPGSEQAPAGQAAGELAAALPSASNRPDHDGPIPKAAIEPVADPAAPAP